MARTRSEIKTLVRLHTGRTKEDLENALCESALKIAMMRHHFKDGSSIPADFAITVATYTVDISSITGLLDVLTATIVEADGERNQPLDLKNRTWWDKFVINPEDNHQGWPVFGLRDGTNILFDRPSDDGLELRLRVTTEQSFTDDDTVCPVSMLDMFVEYYVTAGVFENLTNWDAAKQWKIKALGYQWENSSEPGGELLNAINADMKDSAEIIKATRPEDVVNTGLSIQNLLGVGDDSYGTVRPWYPS